MFTGHLILPSGVGVIVKLQVPWPLSMRSEHPPVVTQEDLPAQDFTEGCTDIPVLVYWVCTAAMGFALHEQNILC